MYENKIIVDNISFCCIYSMFYLQADAEATEPPNHQLGIFVSYIKTTYQVRYSKLLLWWLFCINDRSFDFTVRFKYDKHNA